MNDNLNILRIKVVHDAVEELADDFIFVGGTTVSLYADHPVTLQSYLQTELSSLLHEPYVDEWISVHLDYSEQRRVNYIIGNIEEFVRQ